MNFNLKLHVSAFNFFFSQRVFANYWYLRDCICKYVESMYWAASNMVYYCKRQIVNSVRANITYDYYSICIDENSERRFDTITLTKCTHEHKTHRLLRDIMQFGNGSIMRKPSELVSETTFPARLESLKIILFLLAAASFLRTEKVVEVMRVCMSVCVCGARTVRSKRHFSSVWANYFQVRQAIHLMWSSRWKWIVHGISSSNLALPTLCSSDSEVCSKIRQLSGHIWCTNNGNKICSWDLR